MDLLADEYIDPDSAARLAQAASDIALVLDGEGVVLDVIVRDADLAGAMQSNWRGRPWVETVTSESREKVELLLREAREQAEPTWRQVNHVTHSGDIDRPVRYCAMKMNGDDRYLAVGRDLHAVAELQQRLIDAQETTERDYWRLRQAESRFRLLFQVTSDAVMVVDADNLRIMEANPVAEAALGWNRGKGTGNPRLMAYFSPDQGKTLQAVLTQAQSHGHAQSPEIALLDSHDHWQLSASALRHGNAAVFILRMSRAAPPEAGADVGAQRILQLVEEAPEAIVVTNEAGRLLSVNHAFIEMAELASETAALGSPLSDWLGRSSVDASVLLANVKKNGRVRLFSTNLNSAHRVATDVEVSGVTITEGGDTCYGFIIRSTAQRISDSANGSAPNRSVEQLTELVGSVPLKELVRESADLIERLSIEAALKLTDGNRAAAAEMLGLSRQSLYVKLRRYDLADKGADGD